ncbi:hypothetical protein CAI21_04535 [Alkalilimnicola ehrlichii]|uniref:ANTAR domain-containing protein n=1 Tax=Alkalilimnicola ehrlichii TaxID=351052 RepID=A0A3E0X106_9GAMM|nr:nitrate regulatory protein [Alkalilimnicola ehrlichii]RFA30778.1 hypothetical protein CAI21_04535 [Alkalilimnicola ehrlichii]RFA38355.1 hypothetical protein CAL65_05905 [Alkalilimnicola ehrlichii]
MTSNAKVAHSALDYLIISKQCEIESLKHLLSMGRLVVAISNLVHALQRERGASNMFLGSGGTRYGNAVVEYVAGSRQMEQGLRDCLQGLDTDASCFYAGSRLFSRIAYVVHGFDELESVRGRVRELQITPDVVIAGYSALIKGLLNVVFEAADAAADPDVSRSLVALFNFMQGKELAGQERALGAASFAMTGFTAESRRQLLRLIESQERCFQSFAEFAEPEVVAVWDAVVRGPHTAEVERLRRIACTSDASEDFAQSDAWFTRTTRRIDAMKEVENRLQSVLSALCEQKIADANADLANHRDHVAALADMALEEPAFAVFFRECGGDTAVDSGAYSSGGVGPQLGRSIIDLVQSQSQRLQRMHEELDAARQALRERKTIEKAKGLVMEYHRLSEEEAYKFLRRLAMSQGRKLAEVAAATVAMRDILHKA